MTFIVVGRGSRNLLPKKWPDNDVRHQFANVRFGSLADTARLGSDVCFTPKSCRESQRTVRPLWAISGLTTAENGDYSTTSSARVSSEVEMTMPSVFAVLRLMTSSNLVGCCTGRSEGLAPLRMLST